MSFCEDDYWRNDLSAHYERRRIEESRNETKQPILPETEDSDRDLYFREMYGDFFGQRAYWNGVHNELVERIDKTEAEKDSLVESVCDFMTKNKLVPDEATVDEKLTEILDTIRSGLHEQQGKANDPRPQNSGAKKLGQAADDLYPNDEQLDNHYQNFHGPTPGEEKARQLSVLKQEMTSSIQFRPSERLTTMLFDLGYDDLADLVDASVDLYRDELKKHLSANMLR